MIKKILLKILPNSVIFGIIYKKNKWGGNKGDFFSGSGSYDPNIKGYIEVISTFIIEKNIHNIVEIGCGDFFVTNQILNYLQNQSYKFNYVGYDVVKSLIVRNNIAFSSECIKFVHKDPSKNNIISGDVLLIRQVLQHLSNNRIKRIIQSFKKYKYIIVTEHQVSSDYAYKVIPNLNQVTGAGIRARFSSGVYLEKEPFNCNLDSLIYSFPEDNSGLKAIVNTYLFVN